jgi:hypothetical protein
MAGDVAHLVRQAPAAFRLQHPQRRDADRHQRRLGILGQGQLALRPLEHQLGELLLQRLVHLFEHQPGGGEALRQSEAHADSLGALAWKDEGTCHGSSLEAENPPIRRKEGA